MTKPFIPKDRTISLFKNLNKKNLKQPDLSGNAKVNNNDYKVGLYLKEGNKFTGKMSKVVGTNDKGYPTLDVENAVSLTISVNEHKKEEKHPDYNGVITVDEIKLSVGLWKQKSAKGLSYLRGTFRDFVEAPKEKVAVPSEAKKPFTFPF